MAAFPLVSIVGNPGPGETNELVFAQATQGQEEVRAKTFRDIYFDPDSTSIRPGERKILKKLAKYMRRHPDVRVRLEAHTDDRGTEEYLLGLGQRLADVAKEFLVSQGVAPERIDTISFGKSRPVCVERTEKCRALNRRVSLVLLGPNILSSSSGCS